MNLKMSLHLQIVRVTPQSPAIRTTNPSCDICNYSAPSKAEVLQHIRAVHCGELYEGSNSSYSQSRNYNCNSPGAASVSSVASSRTGMTKSGRVKSRPHVCQSCGSNFTQKIHLETHIKNVHELNKPFVCPFCEYRCQLLTFGQSFLKVRPFLDYKKDWFLLYNGLAFWNNDHKMVNISSVRQTRVR